LRILLHYGGVWLRYDLWIFGLIVGALGRCRCLLLRTVLSRDVIVGYAANDRPGSLRLPGCLAALGTRVWWGGANLLFGSLERVPLAGSTPLEGRQPEFYKYQSG